MARNLNTTGCVAELPWSRRLCPNAADGPDGFCAECRDELALMDAWAEAEAGHEDDDPEPDTHGEGDGWPAEDYERAYGPHAARARFGGAR